MSDHQNRKIALSSLRLSPCAAGLAAAFMLSAALPAAAQTAAEAVDELSTIRIIADPNDPRSNVGSAYAVTEAELERFHHTNIHSVLNKVPGVYVREEDGGGVFPRIGIRASSSGRSNRISIMEDGVPAAMSPYANTSAYYFPTIGRMSTVEVLKGPEALLYGPQTTAGALNMITTPIPDAPSGMLNTEVGRHSHRNIHAYYGATIGQIGILFETVQRNTNGFHKIDRSDHSAGTDVHEYMAKLRWRSAPGEGPRQEVNLKLFKGTEDADVSYLGLTDADFRANPDRRYGLSFMERMERERESVVLSHSIDITPSSNLRTTFYHTDTQRHYKRLNQIEGYGIGANGVISRINNGAFDAAHLQGVLDGTNNTLHPNGVRYGHNYQSFKARGVQAEWTQLLQTGPVAHEITLAARWHKDTPHSGEKGLGNAVYQQINGNLVHISTGTAVHSQGEAKAQAYWLADRMTLGNWTIMPILRHERIKTKANLVDNATPAQIAARNHNSLHKTLPGLGVNYALGDDWTILAGVHKGFAPPGNGVSSGTGGEESTNVEGGVRWRQGNVGVDAIAFYSDYDNAQRDCLVANPCPGGVITGTMQDGSKEVYGLELGAFAELFRAGSLTFPARLTYTWTDGKYTRDSDNITGVRKGDVLDYTPKHTGALQVGMVSSDGWQVNAAFNYTSDACIDVTCGRAGVDNRFRRTDSLFTTDLSASYTLTREVDLYAKVLNVFDKRAITHRGADGARGNPGRYAGAGLRVKF